MVPNADSDTCTRTWGLFKAYVHTVCTHTKNRRLTLNLLLGRYFPHSQQVYGLAYLLARSSCHRCLPSPPLLEQRSYIVQLSNVYSKIYTVKSVVVTFARTHKIPSDGFIVCSMPTPAMHSTIDATIPLLLFFVCSHFFVVVLVCILRARYTATASMNWVVRSLAGM